LPEEIEGHQDKDKESKTKIGWPSFIVFPIYLSQLFIFKVVCGVCAKKLSSCPLQQSIFVGKGGLVALPLDEAADQAARQKKGVIFGGKKKLYNECKNDFRMFSPAIFTFSCVPETALVGSLELDGTKKHPAAAGRSAMNVFRRLLMTHRDTKRVEQAVACGKKRRRLWANCGLSFSPKTFGGERTVAGL
jgi:hypothetical protein